MGNCVDDARGFGIIRDAALFVGHAHSLVIWIPDLQPSGNLFRRPILNQFSDRSIRETRSVQLINQAITDGIFASSAAVRKARQEYQILPQRIETAHHKCL
jgi:hypothetical protein